MVTDAATVLIRFGDLLFREFVSTPRCRPSLIRFFSHTVTLCLATAQIGEGARTGLEQTALAKRI